MVKTKITIVKENNPVQDEGELALNFLIRYNDTYSYFIMRLKQ